jgi:hypothetical protein
MAFPFSSPKDFQDSRQVCLRGHEVTTTYHRRPRTAKKFCDKCGEPTITQCPKCGAQIKGTLFRANGNIIAPPIPIPEYCENCSEPFPWTQLKNKNVRSEPDDGMAVAKILNICTRFHLIATQLRSRHDGRSTLEVTDEYDVQDLMNGLLRLHFDDIRLEEWSPSYAGGSSRMDFLLKKENIVVETKKTRKGLTEKKLGEELIIDIEKYKKHPSCKTLVCFIYDPDGLLMNPSGLENDLSRKEGALSVIVMAVPKGL